MTMKPADIAKEFKEAKNKTVQLTILADMNVTTKQEIAKVLIAEGVPENEIPLKSKRGRPSGKKGAAVEEKAGANRNLDLQIPESVKAACERELVHMQDDIDNKIANIKKLDGHIEDIRAYIEQTEKQMKEIAEFCRK